MIGVQALGLGDRDRYPVHEDELGHRVERGHAHGGAGLRVLGHGRVGRPRSTRATARRG